MHIRELELYAEGNGETLEVCEQGETAGDRALERSLWQQWEGSLEPMTRAGSHFSGKSQFPLMKGLISLNTVLFLSGQALCSCVYMGLLAEGNTEEVGRQGWDTS